MKKVISDIMAFGAILLAGWAVLETAFFEHQLVALALGVAAALVWFWAACLEEIAQQEELEAEERRWEAERTKDLREMLFWDDGEDYEAI